VDRPDFDNKAKNKTVFFLGGCLVALAIRIVWHRQITYYIYTTHINVLSIVNANKTETCNDLQSIKPYENKR
jgi:hypothetical protein